MSDSKAKQRHMRFWRFLHRCVGPFVIRRFNYTYDTVDIEPPFLFISNHVTNTDPFFTGLVYKKAPPAYVASEHLFRGGLVSKLLVRYLDPIPRPKADTGVGTVRAVLKRLREGDPVVLFAEGDCTWDGVSGRIFPATGKLARAAGVPLVTYRIEGGYLSCPRWAKKARKGAMRGRLAHIYSADELKAMTPEAIEEAINRDIFYDTWEAQRLDPVAFRSKAPAEGLERALFICPECGEADCMGTGGNALRCGRCGAEWKLDEYGFLHGPKFGTIAEWDAWQRKAVGNMRGGELFRACGTLTDLTENERDKRREIFLDAENRRIVFRGTAGTPLSEIGDMAMVKTNRLLFTDREGYFEMRSKTGILRPYLLAWQASRGETEEK